MSFFSNVFSSNKESSKQSLKSQQKLIQDTNYVNQIFFGILSTLESLILCYQNKQTSQHYNNKMFSHYDRVDYKTKNLKELKSQLNSQIYVFLFSRRVFIEQFPQEQWKLPRNFDQRKAEQIINYAINLFKQHDDEQSLQMSYDLVKIMRGQLNNIYSEKNKIKAQYSESQRQKMKGISFNQGIHAQGEMDKRGKEIENVYDVSDLTAKINEQNSTFKTQKDSMQIEENSKQCYLVFKKPMDMQRLKEKFANYAYLTKYKSSNECKYYSTLQKLNVDQKYLLSMDFTCIVCVCLDKYDKIEAVKSIQDLSKNGALNSQDNTSSQLSYIVFKQKNDTTILAGRPKSISYVEKHCECRFAKDKEELKKQKKLLNLYQQFYIVPVRLNKEKQVIIFQDYKMISKESDLYSFIGQNPEKQEKTKIFYAIFSKGHYLYPSHLDKHKKRRFNLQDFANTVNQTVTLCRYKEQIEEELKKCLRMPTVLKFVEIDEFVEDIKEVEVNSKNDHKAGKSIYSLNQ